MEKLILENTLFNIIQIIGYTIYVTTTRFGFSKLAGLLHIAICDIYHAQIANQFSA